MFDSAQKMKRVFLRKICSVFLFIFPSSLRFFFICFLFVLSQEEKNFTFVQNLFQFILWKRSLASVSYALKFNDGGCFPKVLRMLTEYLIMDFYFIFFFMQTFEIFIGEIIIYFCFVLVQCGWHLIKYCFDYFLFFMTKKKS